MATLLIIEDEKPIRISMKAFLREAGHQVRLAEGVEEALGILEEQDFDVVITDIIMPRLSGFDLLRTVKERWPDIQVIMFTGEPTIEAAAQALRLGAFDFLPKPITKEDIKKVVARALKMKEMEDEKRRLEKENERYREELEQLVEEQTRKLRESEELHRLLFEDAGVGIGYYTPEGKAIAFNKLAAQFLGGDSEEFKGKTPVDLFGPEAGGEFLRRLIKASESEEGQNFLDHIPFPGGERWFLSNYNRITDEEGKVIGVLAVSQDLSEQKRAEKELRRGELIFRTFFENLATPTAISRDLTGSILVNEALADLLGYSRAELESEPGVKALEKLTPPEDWEREKELLSKLLSGELTQATAKKRYLRKDGGILHAELSTKVFTDADGNFLFAMSVVKPLVVRNVPEKKFSAQA